MVGSSQEDAREMFVYYLGVSRGSLEPKDDYCRCAHRDRLPVLDVSV